MDYIFKSSLKQQLILLTPALIKYGVVIGAYLFFFGFHMQTPIYLYAFLFFFLIDLLPTIILHVQYLKENSKAVLLVNRQTQKIVYKKSHKTVTYAFHDIIDFQYIASYGGGKNSGY